MEDGAAAAAKERGSGDSAMAAANRLVGGADGEPPESEDVSRVLEENEVFEEAMETPRHLLPESDDGAASRVENGAGSVGSIALVVGDKNLEKEEEMVGLEKFVDSTDAVVHDQKPNEQEMVGFEKFVTEEGMAASAEVGCAHREGEDEEESVPIKSNSAVLDSEAGAGLCEVINGSVGNGNKAFAGKKSDNEELERVKSDGPDDLLHGRAESGERLEVTYSECGVDNDAESNEQVAPRRGIQQLKDVSDQSVALSEDPAKFQQPKENSAELDNGFAATNGHASVEREDDGFASNGHASVEKVGSSCSHVINAANDYLKENKADMHETTKKLQKESFENLGHSSSTSNDNKKSSSSLASPSTSNPENLGSHASHPAGLGSSASLLEPSARSLQQTRANGSGPRRVSQPLEELPNDDGEENDEVREKLQMIRVKFLRLAHRLGQTPHNVVVAQVLYRLGLAEQLKRNTNRPGVFSFDRASDVAEQLEAAGQETLDFSCTIMVIGKTGVGKSSTINSIFDEVKLPTDAFQMGTKKVQEVVGMVQGIKVRVIDTPGLVSSSSDQHRNEKTLHSVKRFINKNPPDIVLYFDRLDMQSRDYGDAPLLQTITDIFGVSIWFNAIVVLTHAASAPPDGPNGSPLSYETFVTQRSHVVQQAIRQAAGDVRLMNPVSLVENHSGCRMNRAGQRVLPNGQVWKPQLLLLSFASKILAEANMLLKLQDSPGKPFGSRPRVPPLPFLLSSLLQSRPQLKLPEEQFGDDDNLDEDLDETSDSDEGSDYDDLPPFKYLTKSHVAKLSKAQKKAYFEELDYRERLFYKKQLKEEKRRRKLMKKMADMAKDMPDEHNNEDVEEETSGPASVPEPMPDFVLPNSFDSDNPTHRYRVLDSSNQWLVRPVLDSQGWDHDIGYEGLNVERVFVIKDKIPLSVSGQFTKDKKECTLQMEVASSIKHSESKATSLCLDTHTVGKDIAYTLRGETRFRNFRCNNSSAGVSVTVLGDSMSAGLKFEDKLMISKRLGVLMSGGAMAGRGDVAYGGRLEATLRDKDYPIGRALSTLALSIVDWHGDIALGCNIQSQFPLGRGTNLIGHANLSNKGTGQFGIRLNSSEHLQVAVLALVPILRNVNRIFFGSSQSM